ncbi:ABC transporter substrate-binding protein [Salinibacterium sp. NSLL150]|uniref:siderophore ABC transporter substrate-binding protein n=1 Tax=unclassified Salinibacterium TaxID=2632331 RepID=UPI0018CE7748|nr:MULTISPECIES: ABC transporter substrate-binding protein [unclassified Salinibacterium]MBH0097768.1 ABC transporter substrate-binding protein [Salinibacterium sp. NSLL35]MBH0100523.1 ABC transporter substrate-binding protein [Salinibacterium sp. NSLL150]MBH0103282.1 ABC transporter substrate-binding protein [Salinibacterium sp. NSLL16]MBH0106043.1 ABC transporter substrate-binding protein [Salinibacterium sp. NSLL17]MBH0110181.1 ABC transporter substrate-binding protein [Salinibacterium sp. 
MNFSRTRHGVLVGVLALALAACSTATPEAADSDGAEASVQFEDNNGSQTLATPFTSVVATDNRTFETLASWGIELSAAAVALMPSTISYTQDDSIIDLGNHGEPDLEAVVAAQPDVIINGQRFAQYHDDFAKLVPDAVIVELDPREGEPFDAELKRQTTVLGEIFGKQAEAEKINADFDAAIERVNAAYNGEDSVMAVITSGGEIGYSAPSVGRTLGPLFDIFDFTAALDVDDSSEDHQGDDISVEAIADSNPDWILVMDRDAAILADDPTYVQGSEVLENSEALSGVTAVQESNLVYMPADTYTNEGIQTYTEFFNALADALEAKN